MHDCNCTHDCEEIGLSDSDLVGVYVGKFIGSKIADNFWWTSCINSKYIFGTLDILSLLVVSKLTERLHIAMSNKVEISITALG